LLTSSLEPGRWDFPLPKPLPPESGLGGSLITYLRNL